MAIEPVDAINKLIATLSAIASVFTLWKKKK